MAQQTPPPSPYAARFGTCRFERLRKTGRSGASPLEPELPFISVELDYDQIRKAGRLQLPSDANLDELFLSEEHQNDINSGVRAWQMGAMSEGMPGQAAARHLPNPNDLTGGKLTISPTDFCDELEIHEELWHPIFTREHWFDLDLNIGHGIPGIWSVDNRMLWRELSICIELSSRLFDILAWEGL
jgi:hypothetical protein